MTKMCDSSTSNNLSEIETPIQLESYYMKFPIDEDKDQGLITALIKNGLSTSRADIFEYTHVLFLRREKGRVYYLIDDEGSIYNGKEASNGEAAFDRYFVKNISPVIVEEVTIHLKYTTPSRTYSNAKGFYYYQEWAEMKINNKVIQVSLNSVPHEYTPIGPGTHKLLRPDYSHAEQGATGYIRFDPDNIYCCDAWFPIEINNIKTSRYIHVGHVSHGCVSVYDISKWGEIYDYLILRRKDHSKSKYIGTIIVEPYTRNLSGA